MDSKRRSSKNMLQNKLDRPKAFLLGLVIVLSVPLAIPNFGIDLPYLFILGLVLIAWFMIKWGTVRSIKSKGSLLEIIIGGVIVLADYAENIYFHSELGLIDMIVVFSALALAFYGLKSFKIFWVPAAYGVVLLLGYQLENAIPNYAALQDWMAGVSASFMQLLGVNATVSGHLVALNSGSGMLLLDVQSDCTGIQGVLAFGMLSTMAILDVKLPKKSKLIPLFAIGFAGAFLINILRLFLVFLVFEYLGVEAGTTVHLVAGYALFIVWVFAFWGLAFKYLVPAGPVGNQRIGTMPPAQNPLK